MHLYSEPDWNEVVSHLPGAHILQTRDWGLFKAKYGWQSSTYLWRDDHDQVCAAASVLKRGIPGGLSVLYVPRGPMLDWTNVKLINRVINDLKVLARKQKSIFIKIDPEIIIGTGIPGSDTDRINISGQQLLKELEVSGWQYSQDQIQFRNTALLDLSGDESDWLARMKQKTRYNLRLAQRHGVQVRIGASGDLPVLYKMYAETSIRDGFVIRSEDYYLNLWRMFMDQGLAKPLIAEVNGEVVAALVLFTYSHRAWYLYGMSIQSHREKMPNYLIQWEAMRHARELGCIVYDLWGAPDTFNENDHLWGVFRFKEGLGATVVRTGGAWDYPVRPFLYTLYTRILPKILDIMRNRGKAKTRKEVSL